MIKSKLEAIKNFLVFVFGKHWPKIVALIILIILGVLLWTKDCYIKTDKIDIHTNTKMDVKGKLENKGPDKVYQAPTDFPTHR